METLRAQLATAEAQAGKQAAESTELLKAERERVHGGGDWSRDSVLGKKI